MTHAADRKPRWQRIQREGARPQRLLFASTGTKDPEASEVLYVRAFAGGPYVKAGLLRAGFRGGWL